MTATEKAWLETCLDKPWRYRIDVDNDEVFITDIEKDECVFTFNHYGYGFIVRLLQHLGYNADYV